MLNMKITGGKRKKIIRNERRNIKLMTRSKTKESTPISFRMESGLVDQLKKYSAESMIPVTRLVEQAIREFFEKRK